MSNINSVTLKNGEKGKVVMETTLYLIEDEDEEVQGYADLEGWVLFDIKDIYEAGIEIEEKEHENPIETLKSQLQLLIEETKGNVEARKKMGLEKSTAYSEGKLEGLQDALSLLKSLNV